MKKNKGLAIGIVVILLAVAAWYFFFRTPSQAKIDVGGEDVGTDIDPADIVNPDVIFANAIKAAKQKITNYTHLSDTQKYSAKNIIDIEVTKSKAGILAEAATGKDIVQLILLDAQNNYLTIHKVSIALTLAAIAALGTGGRG